MSKKIKRYYLAEIYGDMVEDKDGDWVKWKDTCPSYVKELNVALDYATKYFDANSKNLKTYKVMGDYIEWLQAQLPQKRKKKCLE